MLRKCPGMDPAFFKPEDIRDVVCRACGYEIEFWKDDVRLNCPKCGAVNDNPFIGNTCFAWCKEALQCRGVDTMDQRSSS